MAENKPVNPADIQRDLKEFIENKYGAQVVFPESQPLGTQEGPPPPDDPPEEKIDFDLKPQELEAHLNDYVVKQEQAKEVLATKICTHYNRMKLDRDDPEFKMGFVGNIKNNIMLIGPTGVGKTYLIKLIADRIGVPFVKGDATKFSETGYVGGDVEDLVRELVREADGSIEKAQYGIIYIDEVDKIASTRNLMGPDVSGAGVQRNLLKLMEETDVDLKPPHDLTSQMESMMQFQRSGKVERKKINTRNILFIVSGAFNGLEEMVKRRLNKTRVGFRTESDRGPEEERTAYLKRVKSDDLMEYGFESEFIGRLPVVAVLEPLSVDDLYEILSNSNCSVTLGKKRDFKVYGIELEFTDGALRRLAEMASEEQTGARSLVSVTEKVLLKFEKTLPSTDIDALEVTEEMIDHPDEALGQLLSRHQVSAFIKAFEASYGVTLSFEPEALSALSALADESGGTMSGVCDERFGDYGHGLKLLGRDTFTIPADAVANPKGYMDHLVKEFYSKA